MAKEGRIPVQKDFYPLVGMNSPGEVIEVNFGQKPFMYDVRKDLEEVRSLPVQEITPFEESDESSLLFSDSDFTSDDDTSDESDMSEDEMSVDSTEEEEEDYVAPENEASDSE